VELGRISPALERPYNCSSQRTYPGWRRVIRPRELLRVDWVLSSNATIHINSRDHPCHRACNVLHLEVIGF